MNGEHSKSEVVTSNHKLSTPVYKHLNGVESWDNASKDARIAFYGAMKGKAYGHEPTRSAWDWFLQGWDIRPAHETSGLNDARLLRRMLAFAYSGPGELYGDDGELQNGAELPVIDFNRDSVSEIERKITERGRRRLAKMQQEEPAAIETIAARIENLTRALRAKQAKIDALMLEFCPGEAPAEISTLSVGVQQALDFIGWKCDGESHADVADNLDIFDAASALRSAILRLQAQLRMVGHQRDEYAALLREARTNLHVPDLVARIERSVDCSSVEPRETSTVTTPLEQLLVEWWSTDMDNAELFNRAVRLSPALAAAMNALPEKAE